MNSENGVESPNKFLWIDMDIYWSKHVLILVSSYKELAKIVLSCASSNNFAFLMLSKL